MNSSVLAVFLIGVVKLTDMIDSVCYCCSWDYIIGGLLDDLLGKGSAKILGELSCIYRSSLITIGEVPIYCDCCLLAVERSPAGKAPSEDLRVFDYFRLDREGYR